MSSKVDPVHFFNAHGVSVLTVKWQGERIDELERENEELRRRLRSAIERNRASAGSEITE